MSWEGARTWSEQQSSTHTCVSDMRSVSLFSMLRSPGLSSSGNRSRYKSRIDEMPTPLRTVSGQAEATELRRERARECTSASLPRHTSEEKGEEALGEALEEALEERQGTRRRTHFGALRLLLLACWPRHGAHCHQALHRSEGNKAP